MQRAALAVVIVVFAFLLTAAPHAVAATGSITIGDGAGGADAEVGAGFARSVTLAGAGPWAPMGACITGTLGEFVPPSYLEHRFALEYPLVDLPDDATVTGATLALRTSGHDQAGQTAIVGYVGDGSIAADDVDVAGDTVLFTPMTSTQRETVDVTALLSPEMVAAGWAGFSLRQEPLLDGRVAVWDCPDNGVYPILTIEYSVPDPEPSATPTAAPTASSTAAPTGSPTESPTPTPQPSAALPDTAVGSDSARSWAFLTLTMATLTAVLMVGARGFEPPTS